MKVIVLTWGDLQGMLLSSHGSKPCRKAAVVLAEVSSTYSTEEVDDKKLCEIEGV